MILKIIEKIYKDDNSVIKSKASSLIFMFLCTLILCLSLTIKTALYQSLTAYIGYLLGSFFSIIFIILILTHHYKITVYSSCILYTIAITLGLFTGELKEYEVLFFPLIIIYFLFFSAKKAAYAIIIYSIAILSILYVLKKQTQEFNPEFFVVSISVIILLYLLALLHIRIMASYIDEISEKKEMLETRVKERTDELNEAKEYAESLFHRTPCGVYTIDNNSKIIDFNEKAEAITGYGKKEMIGKRFNDVCKASNNETECQIETSTGRIKSIERSAGYLHDLTGRVIGEIVMFIDISIRKELEAFKDDIEKVIHHDLKTPLNSIIGFPKMMLADDSISEEYKEYLFIILNAGQNMLNQINISLDLYKLEEETYKFHLVDIDIIEILKQIQTDLYNFTRKKKNKIVIKIDGKKITKKSNVTINTERTLLYMILSNLIKNAIEASSSTENVDINIIEKERFIISIHNKGIIPKDVRKSFFDKYTTSGKKEGNGLGTYSAKIMAKAIGANLYFKTDEKKGTTLYLSLKSQK